MIQEFKADKLTVQVFSTREEMGVAAAATAALTLRYLLAHKEAVNVIFAAAPSQEEFLAALKQEKGVDWHRVNAFHMDEYIGLPLDAPQGFGNFLKARIFDALNFKSVHLLHGNDGAAACESYTHLLQLNPPDVVFMGIGENGHLAFNDPPVADFNDPLKVKTVELDEMCRQQQVNDGCFQQIADVPTHALTLTIPALMEAPYIYCMVPGPAKATAVYNTISQPMNSRYPSTILRGHAGAMLFLDSQSSKMIAIQKA